MNLPKPTGHATDFDFFMGRWAVRHRRLQGRLEGSTTWESFSGTCVAQPLLGGQGNVDDNVLELPAGTYRAATLRAYDPQSRQWAIWWLDSRMPHAVDTPMRGGFDQGTGLFYARETLDGRPTVVRFLWTQPEPGCPRWEQAFSPDDGRSWETNWTMDFRRG